MKGDSIMGLAREGRFLAETWAWVEVEVTKRS
jgi:hypothetical protein